MNVIYHPCMDLVISSRDVVALFDLLSSVHLQKAKCSNKHLSLLTNDLFDKLKWNIWRGTNEMNPTILEMKFRLLTGLVNHFICRICFFFF